LATTQAFERTVDEPLKAPEAVSAETAIVAAPADASLQQLSPEMIDAIARRAVEQLSEKVVQEIAWEVVPQLAELLIKRQLEEKNS
jgi:CRISPR/Cas system-associated protein Csm6